MKCNKHTGTTKPFRQQVSYNNELIHYTDFRCIKRHWCIQPEELLLAISRDVNCSLDAMVSSLPASSSTLSAYKTAQATDSTYQNWLGSVKIVGWSRCLNSSSYDHTGELSTQNLCCWWHFVVWFSHCCAAVEVWCQIMIPATNSCFRQAIIYRKCCHTEMLSWCIQRMCLGPISSKCLLRKHLQQLDLSFNVEIIFRNRYTRYTEWVCTYCQRSPGGMHG